MSPCVKICQLNESGWCKGCGRTVEDLTLWSNLPSSEKTKRTLEAKMRVLSSPIQRSSKNKRKKYHSEDDF